MEITCGYDIVSKSRFSSEVFLIIFVHAIHPTFYRQCRYPVDIYKNYSAYNNDSFIFIYPNNEEEKKKVEDLCRKYGGDLLKPLESFQNLSLFGLISRNTVGISLIVLALVACIWNIVDILILASPCLLYGTGHPGRKWLYNTHRRELAALEPLDLSPYWKESGLSQPMTEAWIRRRLTASPDRFCEKRRKNMRNSKRHRHE